MNAPIDFPRGPLSAVDERRRALENEAVRASLAESTPRPLPALPGSVSHADAGAVVAESVTGPFPGALPRVGSPFAAESS
jgi:hypothetical protein